MSTITTRAGKGSPLTNNEVDANFTNLNTDKAELSGAAFTGAITTNSTVDGRDVSTDGTKLDGIEASADVTDTANVTAAGALMDSELTSIASVKALNQGVATTDSPTFAGVTLATADINSGTIDGTTIGASSASTGTFTTLTATGAFTSVGIDDNATSTAITIDSSENLGIGVVPKTWYSTSTALEIGSMSLEDYGVSGANVSVFANNLYRNTSNAYVYKESDFAASYSQYNGEHTFNTAPSGTADSVATLTPVMKIDSSGRVGIGTSSPTSLLTLGTGTFSSAATNTSALYTSTTDGMVALADGYTWNTRGGAERMRIDASGNVGIACTPDTALNAFGYKVLEVAGANTTKSGALLLSNSSGTDFGQIYADNSGGWKFVNGQATKSTIFYGGSGAAEQMRIDSSGNLLVGKSVTSSSTAGMLIGSNGRFDAIRDGGYVGYFNRLSSDGDIAIFAKDGTTVGSIGSNSGSNLTIGTGDTGIYFNAGSDAVHPWNIGTNAARSGAIDLGRSDDRFKDLYLSGGVYLGGTGSANKLDDYETGTWTLSITTSYGTESLTITNPTGTYTKIGQQVTATIYTAGMNITATGGGNVYLGGLPFSASGGNSAYAVPSFGHTTCFGSQPDGYIAIHNNYVVVTQVGTVSANSLAGGNPRYMMFTITYFTNS